MLKSSKNKSTKTLFYFYKILPLYILDLIIYKTRGTDKSINRGVDRKVNKNKTPGRNKRDLR